MVPKQLQTMVNKILITAIFLACSANLYSQQTDRLITVRELAVKHDKIDEFIALQKEMSQAFDEAEAGRRWVWRRMYGESHTFYIITESDSFAERESGQELMSQAHWDLWLDAISETIKSRELRTYRRMLAIPLKEKPKYCVVVERTIRPDKISEYYDWVESRMPTLEKSRSNGMVWDRLLFGGNNRINATGSFISSLGELDEPLTRLPADERSQLLEGFSDFFEGDVDRYVLRLEEEMSTGNL